MIKGDIFQCIHCRIKKCGALTGGLGSYIVATTSMTYQLGKVSKCCAIPFYKVIEQNLELEIEQ
jgi:hypothetical protein